MYDIEGTAYQVNDAQVARAVQIGQRVQTMRTIGSLDKDVLFRLRRYFKIKNIYHSNAIEGNSLDVGETRMVIEQGMTITGKPLKDQAEARNLSDAIDFLEELTTTPSARSPLPMCAKCTAWFSGGLKTKTQESIARLPSKLAVRSTSPRGQRRSRAKWRTLANGCSR